ncbi:MAG: hypothetical protein CMK59_00720 [Proteobacteria bacterium]|nr:hypothetical protein [Pseudomonadota bacterium]
MSTSPQILLWFHGSQYTDGQSNIPSITARKLKENGFSITQIMCTCGSIAETTKMLQNAIFNCSTIVFIGGIGHNPDDLFIKSLSAVFQKDPITNKQALSWLQDKYPSEDLIPPNIFNTTKIPSKAIPLFNPIGTTCGFLVHYEDTSIYAFPDEPTELLSMLEIHMEKSSNAEHTTLSTFGWSEQKIRRSLPDLQHFLKINSTPTGTWISYNKADLSNFEEQTLKKTLSSILFAHHQTTLEQVISKILIEKKECLALAESCTGGKLSSWMTARSGSSRYFVESTVVYSNSTKKRVCGVLQSDLDQFGAVSRPVAISLAKGIREVAHSNWGIGITGIAGPNGGSAEKPVGTVHIAVAGKTHLKHNLHLFTGSREQITDRAASAALFMLYKALNV